jgi:hypothetical protein
MKFSKKGVDFFLVRGIFSETNDKKLKEKRGKVEDK